MIPSRHVARLGTCVAGLLLLQANPAEGQRTPAQTPRLALEGRIDAIAGRPDALHAGAGLTARLGNYVRAGVIGGAGIAEGAPSGRADVIARFHLDPFRESRWGFYAGGGLSTRMDRGRGANSYLLILAGFDGPLNRGLTTSLEAGLGGGARVGVILRRGTAERR